MTSIATPITRIAPLKRRFGWIGVDMGTAALKVAQVAYARNTWSLEASLIVPHSDPGTTGLSPMVKSLLSETAAFSGHRASCSLPLSHAELRTIDLPPGSDDEIREMVCQELDASNGFNATEREFDFWELETPQFGEGTRSYAVLSVSRDIARQAADDLLESGLKCETIDGVPFAIARAAEMCHISQESDVVAAIDWGYTSVTFVAAANGMPIFVRSLRDCNLGSIIQRMSNELGLTPLECYPLLVNYGLPHPGDNQTPTGLQETVGQFVTETLSSLVDEISKTLSFAGRQLRQRSPKRLLLMGGGATICNVAENLSGQLDRPVAQWGLMPSVASASRVGMHQAPLFAVAAGLSRLGVDT